MSSCSPGPTLADSLAHWQTCSRLAQADFEWLPADSLPEPYHQLLVHKTDMTSTLAHFHSSPISLEVLQSSNKDSLHLREVILRTASTQNPVEYGLIEVHLDSFPSPIQKQILAGQTPLGGILNDSQTRYTSDPIGFFRLENPYIAQLFPPSRGNFLYGRYNQLSGENSQCLARIIEILPELTA